MGTMTVTPDPAGHDVLPASERTTVHRYPEMQSHRRSDLHDVLDSGLVAHVGFCAGEGPVVIPMAYARDGEYLYLHGSTGSGLGMAGGAGVDLAVTVTLVDGLVYASSLYDSTFNYRSAMVFGTSLPVSEQERYEAVKVISQRLMPGRWAEVREPTKKELAATRVLKLSLAEASVKISSGPPDTDVIEGLWTGELPVVTRVLAPVAQPGVDAPVPPSVIGATASLGGVTNSSEAGNSSEVL
jgi:hypothetical protein